MKMEDMRVFSEMSGPGDSESKKRSHSRQVPVLNHKDNVIGVLNDFSVFDLGLPQLTRPLFETIFQLENSIINAFFDRPKTT